MIEVVVGVVIEAEAFINYASVFLCTQQEKVEEYSFADMKLWWVMDG